MNQKEWLAFLKDKIPPDGGNGLYCLWKDTQLAYIGQSINVGKRLRTHNLRRKFWEYGCNHVTWQAFTCDDYPTPATSAARIRLERFLIQRHRPPLNTKVPKIYPPDHLTHKRVSAIFLVSIWQPVPPETFRDVWERECNRWQA